MRKFILLSVLLLISLVSINIQGAEASSEWDTSDVAVDKVFTIKFSSEIKESTVYDQNIFITDTSGKKLKNVEIKLLPNKKEITIGSPSDYIQDETYFLTVSKNIESSKGVKLKNEVKMQFVITNETIEISDITPAINSYMEGLQKQLKDKDNEIAALKEKIKQLESSKPTPQPPTDLSQTIKNVTVQIDEVKQDSDSLKIYVTYINKADKEISTGDSLSKVVANGSQFGYDSSFNFDRWYKKDVPHAASYIEPGVTEKSVIFFKPTDADTINIVLNANWESYRFNDVQIKK